MLKDKVTAKTYSSGTEAIRQIGKKEFSSKVKRNEFEYIQCTLA